MQVEFECLGELEDDIEWKVTYVGSAEDTAHDQVLEEVLVGPVPLGVSKFVLQVWPRPCPVCQPSAARKTHATLCLSHRWVMCAGGCP